MSADDYFDLGYDGVDDDITNEEDEKDYMQMLHDGNCVAPVILYKNRHGQLFWGCSDFPKHRWSHKRLK